MKTCKECQTEKELNEFYKDSRMSDGRRGNCKECHRKTESARYKTNATLYGYNKKDTPKPETPRPKMQRKRRVHNTSSEFYKRVRSCRKLGLTLEELEAMYENQHRKCLICSRPDSECGVLAIDHCHTTGKVRGLLCRDCNVGLGFFKDDKNNLKRAIKYLSK